ncbi:hypothetical protein LCGC14_1558490 [marine sediment metagenome]|uniref:Uncharacterized protein n=1 Tax=marine sediment metagenome TaxID=412755 RepID=A0A0F9J990_9ZZZZ
MTEKQKQRLHKLWEDNKFSDVPFHNDIDLHIVATGKDGKRVTFSIKKVRSILMCLILRFGRN